MATHLPPFIRRIEKIFGCSYAEYLILKPIRNATDAFTTQRSHAKTRGISWEMSLWQWWTVWQESGLWNQRGPHGYVMCRKGDVGPYSTENVFIATARENVSNRPQKTSGLPMGVKKRRDRHETYVAWRRIEGRKVYVGTYSTAKQAHTAYLLAYGEGAQL